MRSPRKTYAHVSASQITICLLLESELIRNLIIRAETLTEPEDPLVCVQRKKQAELPKQCLKMLACKIRSRLKTTWKMQLRLQLRPSRQGPHLRRQKFKPRSAAVMIGALSSQSMFCDYSCCLPSTSADPKGLTTWIRSRLIPSLHHTSSSLVPGGQQIKVFQSFPLFASRPQNHRGMPNLL